MGALIDPSDTTTDSIAAATRAAANQLMSGVDIFTSWERRARRALLAALPPEMPEDEREKAVEAFVTKLADAREKLTLAMHATDHLGSIAEVVGERARQFRGKGGPVRTGL